MVGYILIEILVQVSEIKSFKIIILQVNHTFCMMKLYAMLLSSIIVSVTCRCCVGAILMTFVFAKSLLYPAGMRSAPAGLKIFLVSQLSLLVCPHFEDIMPFIHTVLEEYTHLSNHFQPTCKVGMVSITIIKMVDLEKFLFHLSGGIIKIEELSKGTFKVATRLQELLKARIMFIKGRIGQYC